MNNDQIVECLVRGFLHIGESVFEVSRYGIITRVWNKENNATGGARMKYLGMRISDMGPDSIIAHCQDKINTAFERGEDAHFNYTSAGNGQQNGQPVTYDIRIVNCHPDKDYVLAIVETGGESVAIVEDKWKLALDASGDGMWDSDMEQGKIYFSEKWHTLFGYSAEDITSAEAWSSKIHPEDLLLAREAFEKYRRGETDKYSAEIRYRCKDGSYKWILSRGVEYSHKDDGTPIRFIGTHQDIHARKMMEAELKASEEIFYNSFNYAGGAKALIEPGGKWLEVNDVMCEMTGYTRGELKELHYRDISYHEDVDVDLPYIQKLVTGELNSYTIEKRYISKTRKIIDTMLTVSLIRDDKGLPKYFICDTIDVTGNHELVMELNRKNQALETACENLTDKMRQIDELNHIIAHNLRGPAGNIKILSENKDGFFTQEDMMSMIHDCSVVLMENLDMMVEIEKIKLNENIEYNRCNVNDICKDILNQFSANIYRHSIQIERQFDILELKYPKIYLESILYNLISNAIKYHKPDVVSKISITTEPQNGYIKLSVKDNGLGIDMARHKDKIFKLNQTFHSGYDSKGLGLFMTKHQVESTGGHIWVESTVDEGAEFVVMLPEVA